MQDHIVDKIKKCERGKLYLSITGGGTGCIPILLEGGGASGVFIGANIPYSSSELRNLIGNVQKSCSADTAKKLANSFSFTTESEIGDDYIIGVGCTASLRKAEKEREDRVHEFYIHVHTYSKTLGHRECCQFHIVLNEKRTRVSEEVIVSRFILAAADQYLNLNKRFFLQIPEYTQWIGLTKKDKVDWNVL